MLEVNLSIKRGALSKKLFLKLYERFKFIERFSDFDLEKIYLNYTEDEKTKSNNINIILSEKIVPNELFVLYNNVITDELFLLVSEDINIYDEYMIKCDSTDLIDLLVLCYVDGLQISDSISDEELYDRMCIYEDENYSGHIFEELIPLFKPISLYRLSKESSIYDECGYSIYAYYLLCRAKISDFPWEENTLMDIENLILSESQNIPYYNIILSLSSRQWHHIFLESYRMIEHIFCAVYLKEVSDKINIDSSSLASAFEDVLHWRPPEEESLKKIFDIIECNNYVTDVLKDLNTIKNSKVGDEKLYKWYYKEIRNQIAHYRVMHRNIEFSDEEWNTIIRFNFLVIRILYEDYDKYIQENDVG